MRLAGDPSVVQGAIPARAAFLARGRAYSLLFGLTVFAIALGSSGVHDLKHVGGPLRWAMLGVLAAVELVAVVHDRVHLRGARTLPHLLAMALVGLAVLSTAWSITPRTTLERSVTLGVLAFVAGAGVWLRCRTAAGRREVVDGVLLGTLFVGVASALLLAVDWGDAAQPRFVGAPVRLRGLGENPNTVPLLLPIVLPLALLRLGQSRSRPAQAAIALAIVLAVAFLFLTGARTPAGAAALACGLYAALVPGRALLRRAVLVAGVAGVLLAGFALVAQLPVGGEPQAAAPPRTVATSGSTRPGTATRSGGTSSRTATRSGSTAAAAPAADPESLLVPSSPDTGSFISRPSTIANGSYRFPMWRALLHRVRTKPVLGHGFGTEETQVEATRDAQHPNLDALTNPQRHTPAETARARRQLEVLYFNGGHAENSYLGTLLDLGVVGLVLLVGFAAATVLRGLLRLAAGDEEERRLRVALLAGLAGGLASAVLQSYLTSVGNIACLSFWTVAFALVAASTGPRTLPVLRR